MYILYENIGSTLPCIYRDFDHSSVVNVFQWAMHLFVWFLLNTTTERTHTWTKALTAEFQATDDWSGDTRVGVHVCPIHLSSSFYGVGQNGGSKTVFAEYIKQAATAADRLCSPDF